MAAGHAGRESAQPAPRVRAGQGEPGLKES
jgi:hypothetical protein